MQDSKPPDHYSEENSKPWRPWVLLPSRRHWSRLLNAYVSEATPLDGGSACAQEAETRFGVRVSFRVRGLGVWTWTLGGSRGCCDGTAPHRPGLTLGTHPGSGCAPSLCATDGPPTLDPASARGRVVEAEPAVPGPAIGWFRFPFAFLAAELRCEVPARVGPLARKEWAMLFQWGLNIAHRSLSYPSAAGSRNS